MNFSKQTTQDYYNNAKIESSEDFVVLVHHLLKSEAQIDRTIQQKFSSKYHKDLLSEVSLYNVNLDLIYSLKQIEKFCLNQHLKFLSSCDTDFILNADLLSQIKSIQKRFSFTIQSFYVTCEYNKNSINGIFCRISDDVYLEIEVTQSVTSKLKASIFQNTFTFFGSIFLPGIIISLGLGFMSQSVSMGLGLFSLIGLTSVIVAFKKSWFSKISSRNWKKV